MNSNPELVHKSLVCGPNGEMILDMVEDVTGYESQNAKIKDSCDGFSEERTRRMNVSVPPRLYMLWARRTGSEECWLDPAFLRSFIKENPQYATCRNI